MADPCRRCGGSIGLFAGQLAIPYHVDEDGNRIEIDGRWVIENACQEVLDTDSVQEVY